MATLASLRILLGLDSGDVAKGAGRVRQELTGVQRSANTARDALRGVAAGFGLGVGLGTFQVASRVVGEFTDLLGDSVKAAIAEEAGIKRLDQSLKANVAGWDGNRAAIERVIEARQALGFADDEQRDAMARALVATNDVARAQAVVATAMDLARLKGIDLGSATDALIKIEGGQFRALKALGIELREGATQTEALAAVQAAAAGQAEEWGSGTAGAAAEAGIAIENLKEDFGAGLMPVVRDGAKFLTNELIPALRETAAGTAEFGEAAGDAIGPVGDLFAEIDRLTAPLFTTLQLIPQAGAEIHNMVVGTSELERAALKAGDATRDWVAAEREAAAVTSDAAEVTAVTAQEINDLGLTATATAYYLRNDLIASLNDIPTDIEVNIKVRTDVGLGVAERIVAAGDDAGDTARAQANLDFAESERQRAEERRKDAERFASDAAADAKQHAAEAKRLSEEAARQAERDAADAQRAKEEMWRAAEQAADRYFDRVHSANLDAIDDIRDRRNAELDAANAAIQAPVDAERARLEAIRDAEREAGLRGAVATAETPEDLLAAQRDLQRFLEDERVEFMQGQADAQTALNEAARENANAAADMAIAAEALRDIAARERFDPRVRMNADGTVASVTTGDFLNDAPTVIQIFVDGQLFTEHVDRGLGARRKNITPTSVSTGSAR